MSIEREFLKKHCLERSLPTKKAKAFEKLLKKANESYVLIWQKEKYIKIGREQYYNFEVYCPTRDFANAYAHVGRLWVEYIISLKD